MAVATRRKIARSSPVPSAQGRAVGPGEREQGGLRPARVSVMSASRAGNNPPPGPMASQRSVSTAESSRVTSSRKYTLTSRDRPVRYPAAYLITPVRPSPYASLEALTSDPP